MIDFYRTLGFDIPDQPLNAGIIGASGTTGVDMARLLIGHPCFELVFATSREFAGQSLRVVDPAAPDFELIAPEAVMLDGVDVIFTCLPQVHSAQCVEMRHEAGPVVVDLSGDLRLRDEGLHEKTYGAKRNQDLNDRCVYGQTETMREQLAGAKIVSNPGCYPTCVGLGIFPLAQAGKLNGTIVGDAVSGVPGAGRKAKATTHFCSASGDVRPYNVGRKHRHVTEMEQSLTEWKAADAGNINLILNPHLVPLERGMLAVAATDAPMAQDELQPLLQRAVDNSFHRISVDGDTSTNDAVVLMAKPAQAGDELSAEATALIESAIGRACRELAQSIVCDAEGSTRVMDIEVIGAKTIDDAERITESVATSSLVKTALAGANPNWGRINSAAGNAGVALSPDDITLELEGQTVFEKGEVIAADQGRLDEAFGQDRVQIRLTVGTGPVTRHMLASELSKRYVEINSEYTT